MTKVSTQGISGMLLNGMTAYVSGAAGGIGAAIAKVFAANGAAVVLGDIDVELGEQTARTICEEGGRALFVRHDVKSESDWIAALDAALSEFSGLDILVNNAAIEQMCPLTDVDVTDVERMLATNVTGVILGHKHAIRAMRPGGAAGKGGSIINMSSISGLIGTPTLGVYSATKGAVRLLSKAAAVECGRFGYGIRVNSIHPGLVPTQMGNRLVDGLVERGIFPNIEVANEQMLAAYPIGRFGTALDIANASLYLASGLSEWVTGTEIVVDGGMTIS